MNPYIYIYIYIYTHIESIYIDVLRVVSALAAEQACRLLAHACWPPACMPFSRYTFASPVSFAHAVSLLAMCLRSICLYVSLSLSLSLSLSIYIYIYISCFSARASSARSATRSSTANDIERGSMGVRRKGV